VSEPVGFFATCPKGIEGLLLAELTGFGATGIKETVAGAAFSGTLEVAYRACLWSRLASRVLLTLDAVPAADAAALYAGVRALPWEEHLAADGTLAVDFTGASAAIAHTVFGAQKVKDAVVDRFRERAGRRPSRSRKRSTMASLTFWAPNSVLAICSLVPVKSTASVPPASRCRSQGMPWTPA
jgi:23S rRNA (guanine2445-N2)-methyltransferase / 23S rRNA (guanine2069-N7)-methyltransferase